MRLFLDLRFVKTIAGRSDLGQPLLGAVPVQGRTSVTIDDEDRDATWKQGVGIYGAGHDFGKGDTVEIEGEPHRVVEMRRMHMEAEAVTLIVKAASLSE